MDNFNLKKYLTKGILLKEKHSVIPNLERYIQLTDPSAELDDNDYAEKEAIELQAKQDGTLDDLKRAASINHWGRYEPQDMDNLAFRQYQQKSSPNRITKSGKLNQNSAVGLKNTIKLDRSIKEEQEPSTYYKLGYQFGPNRRSKIDPETVEVKNILNMADTLYNKGIALKDLESGPAVEFTKGLIASAGSSSMKYSGVADIIRALNYIREKGIPK
jgi:hypothetical protein